MRRPRAVARGPPAAAMRCSGGGGAGLLGGGAWLSGGGASVVTGGGTGGDAGAACAGTVVAGAGEEVAGSGVIVPADGLDHSEGEHEHEGMDSSWIPDGSSRTTNVVDVMTPDSKLVSLLDDLADMEISFKSLQNPGKSLVLDSVVGMDFSLSDSGMFQEEQLIYIAAIQKLI
uniref:Uncharacterized protein n=1 Tax=Oryza meridionalis TaxID=40149 RepID=A0A0E0DC58_9ORYZ